MKKLILNILLLFLSFNLVAQSESSQECRGDGGVVYYPTPAILAQPKKVKSYTIKGIVLLNDSAPAIGASILPVKKKKPQSTTDLDGKFTIDIKGKDPIILMVSFWGYNVVKLVASPEYDGQEIIISLREIDESQELDRIITIKKPAIYLYPEVETKVIVAHQFKGEILSTYPAYDNGWEVIACPDGKLHNLKDKRNYSYLFWDGYYEFPTSHYNYKNGFYVSNGNYASFLQEKLEHIGLNETEINDFIVYWLPALNEYDQVFIHFRVNDDIGGSSKLTVTPKPDTMIRVFMEFKEWDDEGKKLPEQKLPSFKREKFTLLEWGGGEIQSGTVL